MHQGTATAAIDWEAAVSALHAGELPSSGGERRILLLSASLADRAPASLGDAITGIDDSNAGLLVKAVLHASGRRQVPRQQPNAILGPVGSRNAPGRTGHRPAGRIRDS
jgi:hypothetical protein